VRDTVTEASPGLVGRRITDGFFLWGGNMVPATQADVLLLRSLAWWQDYPQFPRRKSWDSEDDALHWEDKEPSGYWWDNDLRCHRRLPEHDSVDEWL